MTITITIDEEGKEQFKEDFSLIEVAIKTLEQQRKNYEN